MNVYLDNVTMPEPEFSWLFIILCLTATPVLPILQKSGFGIVGMESTFREKAWNSI